MAKKKKAKSIAVLVEDCAVALQLYVRVKAADYQGVVECVTCGDNRHYKDEMQGGHFISRKWISTKIMEENVHPQCSSCNGGFGGKDRGNPIQYTLYMQDTYGRDFVEELERKKHEVVKRTKAEVIEYTKELKSKTRLLQEEKGI